MPKLWSDTISAHREEVRGAIVETTAALAGDHGPLSVSMSQIAEATGIGRATLYKYFPDVASILVAWHERHVASHLSELRRIGERDTGPEERLAAVLEAYALMMFERPHNDVSALVHGDEHVAHAERELLELLRDLLTEAREAGEVRTDVSAKELATYCMHALSAANRMSSRAAARRLAAVVLTGVTTR